MQLEADRIGYETSTIDGQSLADTLAADVQVRYWRVVDIINL